MNFETFNTIFERIWARRVPFLVVFFFAVLISYAILVIVDFIPEPVTDTEIESIEEVDEKDQLEAPLRHTDSTALGSEPFDPVPTKIIFDTLDREVAVLNPQSDTIADLDAALLRGAVRHPDSADFETIGNIFILGHSSYLPTVFNKNFQAFNGIQNLTWGDTIRLQSKDYEYTYRVDKVYKAKASAVTVPVTEGKAKLTLATCNTFGEKDDRFMVESSLISKKAL